MKTTTTTITALFLAAALAGCGVPPGQPTGKGKEQKPATAENAFERPAPTGAEHDPRVIGLKSTTDEITAALTAVRDRLKDIRSGLEVKGRTETDLLKVAKELKALTGHAREDADAIMRAAKDLREALPLAQKGYAATAEYYRERAAGLKDPALKAIQLRMAGEMDRLAIVTPERVDLTDRFIAQLAEAQEFLAQADRCLGDTKTALEILSAGPTPVTVSDESKAFRRHLEVFLALVEEYQKKLLSPPPAGSSWDRTAPARPDCPPAPTPTDATLVTDLNAASRNLYQPYRCEKCGSFHVGVYRVSPDDPAIAGLKKYSPVGHEQKYVPTGGR